MDQVFLELIGKPILNRAKIISVVAENFTFLQEQAKFLKATLDIPTVKQLPLESVSKYLINIGPVHVNIKDQLIREKWVVKEYQQISKDICAQMKDDVSTTSRSIIYINDASRLNLLSDNIKVNFLRLVDEWKRLHNNFVVILYQNASPCSSDSFLRDIEYLSDASIRTKSYDTCYFQAIWFQTLPSPRTLIPPKVETSYITCKIGKSYWSSDLLCFFDRKEVPKDHDPDHDTQPISSEQKYDSPVHTPEETTPVSQPFDMSSTLPYTRAQNPEQSRIFYYPDKEDDVDEDDPDNDLGI